MKRKLFIATTGAVLAVLVASAAAVADTPSSPSVRAAHAKTLFRYVGKLQSAPAGTSLTISVESGNRLALKSMLGQSQIQTFATGSNTEFLKWSKGIPTVVGIGDLAVGDYLVVNVRAPRGSSLADVEAASAGLVGDHGPTLNSPDKPLYLFRGRLSAPAADGKITLDVKGGNRRALRLLVGQSASESFSYGDETIFLLWQGKVPTVIDASKLVVGDWISVRIRAKGGSSLSDVLATAANHVGDHEPAARDADTSAP